jgi:site-specific DNA-methyltransferase (adenine-specific)
MSVMIREGDCIDVLKTFADQSVHCVVTSPPYWKARNYGGGAGELGAEREPMAFVERLLVIFDEVRRVLRDDGTCWVNLSDTMHGGSLAGIPWSFASAMSLSAPGYARRWFLRSAAPWIKRSPMPEAVTNRPSNGLEYFFLFTKKATGYHYDADAVRLPVCPSTLARDQYTRISAGKDGPYAVRHDHETPSNPKGRNRRNTDWWMESLGYVVASASYGGNHYAVMPPKLVEPAISAGCPAGGVVLDPFMGTGTTLEVAVSLGRSAIGIELNPDYVRLAEERMAACA